MEWGQFADPVAQDAFRECSRLLLFEGMVDEPDRTEMADEMVRDGYEAIAGRGELDRQPDPEWLFRGAAASPGLAACLAAARADGVTDDEIRAWHGLPFLLRAVYQQVWSLRNHGDPFEFRTTDPFFEPRDPVEYSPVFRRAGDPLDPRYDVAPLPAELFPRYWQWRTCHEPPPEQIEFRVTLAGTFNAYLRAEVAAGRL